MENLDHTADDKERLRQVTSTIFGARAASEIPLGKSKKQTTDKNKGGNKHGHIKHFGPYTVNDILAVRALFNSYDEDGSGEIKSDLYLLRTCKTATSLKMLEACLPASIKMEVGQ